MGVITKMVISRSVEVEKCPITMAGFVELKDEDRTIKCPCCVIMGGVNAQIMFSNCGRLIHCIPLFRLFLSGKRSLVNRFISYFVPVNHVIR